MKKKCWRTLTLFSMPFSSSTRVSHIFHFVSNFLSLYVLYLTCRKYLMWQRFLVKGDGRNKSVQARLWAASILNVPRNRPVLQRHWTRSCSSSVSAAVVSVLVPHSRVCDQLWGLKQTARKTMKTRTQFPAKRFSSASEKLIKSWRVCLYSLLWRK